MRCIALLLTMSFILIVCSEGAGIPQVAKPSVSGVSRDGENLLFFTPNTLVNVTIRINPEQGGVGMIGYDYEAKALHGIRVEIPLNRFTRPDGLRFDPVSQGIKKVLFIHTPTGRAWATFLLGGQ